MGLNTILVCLFFCISFSIFNTQEMKAQYDDSIQNANLYKDFKTEFIWEASVKIANTYYRSI
jgi:hypothetical protein